VTYILDRFIGQLVMDEDDVLVVLGMARFLEKDEDLFLGNVLERDRLGVVFIIGLEEAVKDQLLDNILVHSGVDRRVLFALELVDAIAEVRATVIGVFRRDVDPVDVLVRDVGVRRGAHETAFLTNKVVVVNGKGILVVIADGTPQL
jgi:adenosine/AMP kinase